jgi:predicted RNase H-like nuclease
MAANRNQRRSALGVDGCRGGWVGALVGDGGVRWLGPAPAAVLFATDVPAIGIDIPIGLPDRGPRACDVAARRLLGRRASSVFPAPVRAALEATTYADARRLVSAATGASMSAQAFGIVAKVREVDAAMTREPPERVFEVHPEVSFAVMAGHSLPSKHTPAGIAARVEALARHFPVTEALAELAAGVATDDALDALAGAWSALRWLDGAAMILPAENPPMDRLGLPMRIVA